MIEKFSAGELSTQLHSLSFGYGGLPIQNEHEAIDYMLSYPTYMYTQPQGFNIDVALGRIQVDMLEREMRTPIIVDGENLYEGITIVYNGSGTNEEIHIGDYIVFSKKKQKLIVTYSDKLSERLRDFKYIRYLLSKEIISQRDDSMVKNSDEDYLNIDRVQEMIAMYQELQNAMAAYGIQKEFLFSELKEDEWGKVKAFIDATNYGKAVPFSFEGKSGIGLLEFANIKIFICCLEDTNGKFKIKNPFEMPEFGMYYKVNGMEKAFLATPYFAYLKHERLSIIDNLNTLAIKNSVLKFQDGSSIYNEQIRRYILEILLAYDINGNCDLLELADELEDELEKSKSTGLAGAANIINRLQINVRKGFSLSDEEISILMKLKSEFLNNNYIMACCSILLQSFQEANYYIDKMNPEERENFNSFPIKNLSRYIT